MIHLISDDNQTSTSRCKHKSKRKKIVIIVSAFAAVYITAFAVYQIVYFNNMLNHIDYDDGVDFQYSDESYFEESDDYSADAEPATVETTDIVDANTITSTTNASINTYAQGNSMPEDEFSTISVSSTLPIAEIEIIKKNLDEYLYDWANNGMEMLSSEDVINVMLFGVDEGKRSDAMMLLSLNLTTKTITLISIMRDSYTYMNINGQDRYYILGAAYLWGGPATVVKTIENNYKIKIDRYISVDFYAFPKIIDSFGGINIELRADEAEHLREQGFNVQAGNVLMDGQTALAFCQIRKIGSDVDRTRRQRDVISAIIDKSNRTGSGQVMDSIDYVFQNVRTDYSKAEIISLSYRAKLNGWTKYGMTQITSPGEMTRQANAYSIKGLWTWVVDYPLEARNVQYTLYGKTNITLEAGRVTAFDTPLPD